MAMVSTPAATPAGEPPVRVRFTLTVVSPPVKAPPEVLVNDAMEAPVRLPEFWVNARLKSVVTRAPDPAVVYAPSSKVTST